MCRDSSITDGTAKSLRKVLTPARITAHRCMYSLTIVYRLGIAYLGFKEHFTDNESVRTRSPSRDCIFYCDRIKIIEQGKKRNSPSLHVNVLIIVS